jgi:hypothetical protein
MVYNLIRYDRINIILSMIVFLIGLYFVTHVSTSDVYETFDIQSQHNNKKCPNILVEKDNMLYLFNKSQPEIPGKNPIIFHNLDEYTEYIKYQRSIGKHCPLLYLQHVYSADGKGKYHIYPSPDDRDGSIMFHKPNIRVESKLINAAFNQGSMPSYDDKGHNNGLYTPLDKMFHSKEYISDNAMDPNWGGIDFSRTQSDVKNKYRNTMLNSDPATNDLPAYVATKYKSPEDDPFLNKNVNDGWGYNISWTKDSNGKRVAKKDDDGNILVNRGPNRQDMTQDQAINVINNNKNNPSNGNNGIGIYTTTSGKQITIQR